MLAKASLLVTGFVVPAWRPGSPTLDRTGVANSGAIADPRRDSGCDQGNALVTFEIGIMPPKSELTRMRGPTY
jgi:hypothetical protein